MYFAWSRCVYKTGNTPMMSMHGKVADFQIWDQALPDEQLLKVTFWNLSISNKHFARWPAARSSPRATFSVGKIQIGFLTLVVARWTFNQTEWYILLQLAILQFILNKVLFHLAGSQGGSWPRNRNLSQILCQLPCGALQTQSELRGHTYIALYILVITLKGKLGEKNL